jgi:hypothetical protein
VQECTEEIHNVDDETDVINDRNEVEDNLSLIVYELNEKMKKRTTYPVDTNSYKVRLDANESFIDPGKQFRQEIADALQALVADFWRHPAAAAKRANSDSIAMQASRHASAGIRFIVALSVQLLRPA